MLRSCVCALQSTRHTIWHHIVFTAIQSSLHLKTNVEIVVSVPTTHHTHTHYYQFCEKVGIYSVFVRSMPTHSDDFTPWPNASSFSNQSFRTLCALCGSVCLRYFFPSHKLNFPHQMEKISIGKEQLHRWWYAQARIQTYVVHDGKKLTNEKSALLSHQHVTIFIPLLGVFLLFVTVPSKYLCVCLEVCVAIHNCDHTFSCPRSPSHALYFSLLPQWHGMMLHVFRLNKTEW